MGAARSPGKAVASRPSAGSGGTVRQRSMSLLAKFISLVCHPCCLYIYFSMVSVSPHWRSEAKMTALDMKLWPKKIVCFRLKNELDFKNDWFGLGL